MRRRAIVVSTCGAAAVLVAGAMLGANLPDRADERTTTVRSTSSTTVPMPASATEPPEPVLVPAPVIVSGLPDEGVAVTDGDAVLLLTVDGEMIRRLDGFTLVSSPAVPDETVLKGPEGSFYVIDALAGTLQRLTDADAVPLAYGAKLVNHYDSTTVERDGAVAFDMGRAEYAFEISYDRDIVTHTSVHNEALAYDLRTGATRSLPRGCHVADRHGAAWFLICWDNEHHQTRVLRLAADDRTTVVAQPTEWGSWLTVMVSPDGRRFLATAMYECDSSRVFAGSTAGHDVEELGTLIGAAEEPNTIALGYTASGSAVFTAVGSCGPLAETGVYALDGKEVRAIYTPAAPDEDWLRAVMWTRPPGAQPASSSSRRS